MDVSLANSIVSTATAMASAKTSDAVNITRDRAGSPAPGLPAHSLI